jgi:hypothetical protein
MYKIIHADEVTGTITVQFDSIVIVLPLDENNNAPEGEALDLLIYNCIPSYNENVTIKDSNIKIANWNSIADLVDLPELPPKIASIFDESPKLWV